MNRPHFETALPGYSDDNEQRKTQLQSHERPTKLNWQILEERKRYMSAFSIALLNTPGSSPAIWTQLTVHNQCSR